MLPLGLFLVAYGLLFIPFFLFFYFLPYVVYHVVIFAPISFRNFCAIYIQACQFFIHHFYSVDLALIFGFNAIDPVTSGIEAPPTSFSVSGKQYIAVLAGWGGDAGGDVATLSRLFPGEVPSVPDGGSVWVFALE